MKRYSVYTPQSFRLSGEAFVRNPPRKPEQQQGGYLPAYDSRTVVYDILRVSGDTFMMICPPLSNLSPEFSIRVGGDRVPYRQQTLDRVDRIVFTLSPGTEEVVVSVGGEEQVLRVPLEGIRDSAAPRRMIQTLSLDNPLEWLSDWAAFYHRRHGTNEVLIYDNGSAAYDMELIGEVISRAGDFRHVRVVEWKYPYGPGGGVEGMWDSDYCQLATFEHSRWLFSRHAKSLINADVDEFMISPFGLSVHAIAENSALGGIAVPGVWVLPEPRNCLDGRQVSYRDFDQMAASRSDRHSPPKWVLVPHRIPKFSQLRTHRLKGWYLPRLPGVTFRHYRGLSTQWREQSDGWVYSKSGRTWNYTSITDNRMKSEIERLGSDPRVCD